MFSRKLAIAFRAAFAAMLCFSVSAKVKFYTLVEKTRAAELIEFAKVDAVGGGTVTLSSQRAVKGQAPANPLRLPWSEVGTFELPVPKLEAAQQVLVFANREGNSFVLFAGPQGILKLETGWPEIYQNAIKGIMAFDAAKSVDAKTTNLVALVNVENRIANLSGLEIIYLEYHTKNFRTDDLVKPVTKLAESEDLEVAGYAIQVLSRIGDKSAIPVLIKLLSGPNSQTAGNAHRVLKSLTRKDLAFDAKQPAAERAKAAERWQEWWNDHKDKINLIK